MGSLTPGKYADVVVLSRGVFADGPAALLDTAVDVTIVAGEVVHRRG
jgi:predicted amidohydrolase YtcJ